MMIIVIIARVEISLVTIIVIISVVQVNDARRYGDKVHIVTPDWLWSCSERWERVRNILPAIISTFLRQFSTVVQVSEQLFTLTKTSSVTRRPPAHCSSPEIAFAQRCADIDLNLDGEEECITLFTVSNSGFPCQAPTTCSIGSRAWQKRTPSLASARAISRTWTKR